MYNVNLVDLVSISWVSDWVGGRVCLQHILSNIYFRIRHVNRFYLVSTPPPKGVNGRVYGISPAIFHLYQDVMKSMIGPINQRSIRPTNDRYDRTNVFHKVILYVFFKIIFLWDLGNCYYCKIGRNMTFWRHLGALLTQLPTGLSGPDTIIHRSPLLNWYCYWLKREMTNIRWNRS